MKPRVSIEPSILSADFARLGQQAKEADLTFGPGVVKSLRKSVSLFLDAHLMIDNPHGFLEEFARSGANRIIVHQEVCKDLPTVLQSIKKLKVEAGVAINPGTPVTTVESVLDVAHCVQVMTVSPGFAGQRFMEDQLSKIQRLRREIDQRHLKTSIVVDGGIDPKTAFLAVRSGATVLVAGSSIYNQTGSVAQNVTDLRKSIAEAATMINPSAN